MIMSLTQLRWPTDRRFEFKFAFCSFFRLFLYQKVLILIYYFLIAGWREENGLTSLPRILVWSKIHFTMVCRLHNARRQPFFNLNFLQYETQSNYRNDFQDFRYTWDIPFCWRSFEYDICILCRRFSRYKG